MPRLTIGFRRAEITAFWIVVMAISSLALALVATLLAARAPWAWAAAALALPLPGLGWPQWFEFGVRGWNKGVRMVAGALRAYVLRVCYYVLFGAVSWTGSSLDLALGNGTVSRWISKGRHQSRPGDREPRGAGDEARSDGLLAAVRNPGQAQSAWTVFLLPIVALLLWLGDEEQESAPPSSTYTLY